VALEKGLTAVVTGASSGIGAGIASALAAGGTRLVMIARNEERLREAASRTPAAIPVVCDVSDPASVERAVERITKETGGAPEILVNNAGLFRVAPLSSMAAELFTETINTNLIGPFLFVSAFLAGMQKRGAGHVVTIGSIADRQIFPENGAYSAAKFGLRALHEVLRAELRGSGVRATLISPSAVNTPLWDAMSDGEADGRFPPRSGMLSTDAVVGAVMYALSQPATVNIDELRLSRS